MKTKVLQFNLKVTLRTRTLSRKGIWKIMGQTGITESNRALKEAEVIRDCEIGSPDSQKQLKYVSPKRF